MQTGEIVAIKKVLQDKRFKNREREIMKQLFHPNIVHLRHCFYSDGEKKGEKYLNLVLEFVPKTVWEICKIYNRNKRTLPTTYVRLYMYQVRCVAFSCVALRLVASRCTFPELTVQLTRSSAARWGTSTCWGSATETSSQQHRRVGSSGGISRALCSNLLYI